MGVLFFVLFGLSNTASASCVGKNNSIHHFNFSNIYPLMASKKKVTNKAKIASAAAKEIARMKIVTAAKARQASKAKNPKPKNPRRVIQEQPVGYNANPQFSMSNIDDETKVYSFSVLQPFRAFAMGLRPGIPDNSIAPTFKFSSRSVFTLNPVANGTTFSLRVIATPFGNMANIYTTVYAAGVPLTYAAIDDPGYASWPTTLDYVRTVAYGFRVRSTTALLNASGQCTGVQGEINNVKTTSTSVLNNMATAATFSLSSPSSVGQVVRTPLNGSVAQDLEYWLYSSSAGNATNCLVFDLTGCSALTNSYEFEVVKHYEARPISSSASLCPSSVSGGDPSQAAKILSKAINSDPVTSQARSVKQDGEKDPSLSSDIDSVFGGVQSLLRLGTKVGSVVSGIGRFLFGKEKLLRHLESLGSNERKLLQQYLDTHKTLELACSVISKEVSSERRLQALGLEPGMEGLVEELVNRRAAECKFSDWERVNKSGV